MSVETTETAEETAAANRPFRFEAKAPLLVAGTRRRYDGQTVKTIPAQWERFAPHVGRIPGQVGGTTYGVCLAPFEGAAIDVFEYVSGVEVRDFSGLSAEWSRVSVPALRYAVFTHREHVSTLPRAIHSICSQWFPASGLVAAPAIGDVPALLERYGESFDPMTGLGDIEVWIPIQA